MATAVGAAVAVAGSISYGADRALCPAALGAASSGGAAAVSALSGLAFFLAADGAAQLLVADAELKLGVVTALIGTPFFLLCCCACDVNCRRRAASQR
ncbi:MAG: iron chelate uptake ABC transporter family permease subunit [Gammaproteobacteria bacterium]